MQGSNETNYLIYWLMVSFRYFKILWGYLLDYIYNVFWKCPAKTSLGNSAFSIAIVALMVSDKYQNKEKLL